MINRRAFVRQAFAYLTDLGYIYHYENVCRVECVHSFTHMNGSKIIMTEDIRENQIDLQLYKKQSKVLLEIFFNEYIMHMPLKGFEQMYAALKGIYMNSDFRRGMRFDTFQGIITLYAGLVRQNLDVIVS